jgi:hypothetical protein
VERQLQNVAAAFNSSEGVHVHVQVDEEACVVGDKENGIRITTIITW